MVNKMESKLTISAFSDLRKYLLNHLGLNFSTKQEKELMQKMNSACSEFGFEDTFEFVQWLLKNGLSNKQLEVLASYITIGETYFFREKQSFNFLEHTYLPSLLQKRRGKEKHIKIWSAGCASGEEAYSIAILLVRTIPNFKDWKITILATDINPVLLKKAEKGIYSKWSFRNNPNWLIPTYFNKVEENLFQILPEIRDMVTFAPLNLAKNVYPSIMNNTNAIDIIFCRNVLIYFSRKGIKEVTNRLYKSLITDGLLIVSPVEMSNLIYPNFGKINYEGYTIYQKKLNKDSKKKPKNIHLAQPLITKKPKKSITKPIVNNNTIEKPVKEIDIEEISNFEQALVLIKQGSFEQAENQLSKLLTEDYENQKQIISLLAKTKANLGQLDEAKILCEKGLEIDNSDFSLYYLIATIMQEQGNDDEAISSLQRAIYLDHNFVLAHFLLGNLNIKKGNNTTGEKYINNALNILSNLDPKEIVPESDGLTVERFTEIITTVKI